MIDYSPDDIVHRCARCDSAEDRVNGFCSVECEDMADVERQRDEARDLACCLLSLHSFSERDVREAWASWRADDDPESEEMAAPLRELIHELLHTAPPPGVQGGSDQHEGIPGEKLIQQTMIADQGREIVRLAEILDRIRAVLRTSEIISEDTPLEEIPRYLGNLLIMHGPEIRDALALGMEIPEGTPMEEIPRYIQSLIKTHEEEYERLQGIAEFAARHAIDAGMFAAYRHEVIIGRMKISALIRAIDAFGTLLPACDLSEATLAYIDHLGEISLPLPEIQTATQKEAAE
jgi:hypothetical protein